MSYGPIAAFYDALPLYQGRRDQAFYLDLCIAQARVAGEILELGCGTGRILAPAAQAGCRITGVDNSPEMLAVCRDRLRRANCDAPLIEADLTSFHLGGDRRFSLVTIPFRPLQHLITAAEQLACLNRIREHLEPGGRLVFDVFQPSLEALVSPLTGSEIEDTPEFDLPDGRKLRRTFRILSRHRVAQCFHLQMRYYLRTASGESTTVTQTFPMRYYFPIEVEHLLARAGWRIDSVYGDFDSSPLTDQSPEMIFTASLL